MNRWRWAFLAVLLACIPMWVTRGSHPSMMSDTDTIAILEGIESRKAPFSWFAGDWPLGNHFYRPITTLTFELDNALHPGSAAGFGATNALLAIACVLLLFWFLREFTDDLLTSTAAAGLFAVWVASPTFVAPIAEVGLVGLAIVALVVSLLGRRSPGLGLAGVFAAAYASLEVGGLLQVRGGSLDWIPGRTATTMTVFALIAMAAYARFERLGAVRAASPATPFDKPATKSTAIASAPTPALWVWPCVSVLATALALGSYEQAVMLPACLLAVAVVLWLRGMRVRWGVHVAFWAVLAAYILLRKAVIPPGTSTYQLQQYRTSWDVMYTVLDYAFPANRSAHTVLTQLDLGLASLMLTQLPNLGRVAANAVAYLSAVSRAGLSRQSTPTKNALGFYVISALAFLPMAWLKPFPSYNHYHFWPMTIRAGFAIAMVVLLVQLLKRAVTPRAIQAPQRLTPAPGSLPRP